MIFWEDLIERPYMGCQLPGCDARAECILDGSAFCLDCAERVLDRREAIALNPRMRSQFPELTA